MDCFWSETIWNICFFNQWALLSIPLLFHHSNHTFFSFFICSFIVLFHLGSFRSNEAFRLFRWENIDKYCFNFSLVSYRNFSRFTKLHENPFSHFTSLFSGSVCLFMCSIFNKQRYFHLKHFHLQIIFGT